MGWLKRSFEFLVENNPLAIGSRAVTGRDAIKKTDGKLDLFEESKFESAPLLIGGLKAGANMKNTDNPLKQLSGSLNFGKETNQAWLPFALVGGLVLILIVRGFNFKSGRKRR